MIKINETPISTKDLIEGKVYSDISKEILFPPILLKFIKYDEVGDPRFKHVGGHEIYSEDDDGLIPFFKENSWYEVENFEEQK
jgi:hypothetical protein